jgi:hypothetical protein
MNKARGAVPPERWRVDAKAQQEVFPFASRGVPVPANPNEELVGPSYGRPAVPLNPKNFHPGERLPVAKNYYGDGEIDLGSAIGAVFNPNPPAIATAAFMARSPEITNAAFDYQEATRMSQQRMKSPLDMETSDLIKDQGLSGTVQRFSGNGAPIGGTYLDEEAKRSALKQYGIGPQVAWRSPMPAWDDAPKAKRPAEEG